MLLPLTEQRAVWPATAGAFRALSTVQLLTRHWVSRNSLGDIVSEVRGEGVVGRFPILRAGAALKMF